MPTPKLAVGMFAKACRARLRAPLNISWSDDGCAFTPESARVPIARAPGQNSATASVTQSILTGFSEPTAKINGGRKWWS